jgi:hypothetical protein
MNRFSEDQHNDRAITLPLGEQGRFSQRDLLRAADTVIIKVRGARSKREGKRLCLPSVMLMGVVAALSSVIVALVVLILKV